MPPPPNGDSVGNGLMRVILRDFRGRVVGRARHDNPFAIFRGPLLR